MDIGLKEISAIVFVLGYVLGFITLLFNNILFAKMCLGLSILGLSIFFLTQNKNITLK